MSKYTFKEFQREYPDDGACLDKIMEMRYGGTEFECPACERQSKFHRMGKRRGYSCQHCGHHIFPCVGTIFEKSRTPLTSWFFAMYLMTSTRHGVAAKELERQIGCTYKCAWRMAHALRKLMAVADISGQGGPLSGHVEIDESYVGGKPRKRTKAQRAIAKSTSKVGRGAANKSIVLGLIERGGNARAGTIPDVFATTIEGIIKSNVRPGSKISTDEFRSYNALAKLGYDHQTVAHGSYEFVRGDAHTNSVEGYWSRLKNSIRGTHVHVSGKHLWKYTAEFSFRYNMRKNPAAMFDRLVSAFALPRLADD